MNFEQIALTDSQIKLLGEFCDSKSIQFHPETEAGRYADAKRLEYFDFIGIAKATNTAHIKERGRDYYLWHKGVLSQMSLENKRWWANFVVSIIAIILSIIAIVTSIKSKQIIEITDHIDYPKQGDRILDDDTDPLGGSEDAAPVSPEPNSPIMEPTP